MVQSNALSWRPNLCPDNAEDNREAILLPESIFIQTIDTNLKDLIISAQQQDRVVIDALEALKNGGIPPMKSSLSDWRIEDDLIFYKDCCYMPDDITLHRNILQ